jgi:hypothetical protein
MVVRKRMRFVRLQTAWMLGVIVLLAAFGALAFDLFVLLTAVGFLIVTEFTTTFSTTPDWRRRIRWLAAVLVLVSGALLVRRIATALPPGVF